MGRPTAYNVKLGDKICVELAKGKSIYTICKSQGMPAPSSVYLWVAKGDRGEDRYKAFSEQYVRAREAQCHALIDQTIPIADDGSNDTYVNAKGEETVNTDVIARSKLRVDTRFRYAEKLHPKKYGNKIQNEHSGKIETNPDDLESRIAELLGKAGVVEIARGEKKTQADMESNS